MKMVSAAPGAYSARLELEGTHETHKIRFTKRGLPIIEITNPNLAAVLNGLVLLRTPFSQEKLARIFARLNAGYDPNLFAPSYAGDLAPLFWGTDLEDWVSQQTRDRRPGVYAEISDKGRFIGNPAGLYVKEAEADTICVVIYRVDSQGQTLLRALFGFNL
jgi:hypothetical protein